MSGFPILDLVIGMIFIFFLLSIITSSAVEVILTLFQVRAGILAKWLREVFNLTALHPNGTTNTGVTLGQAIMDHCMTTVLSSTNKSTSYIKASDFVNAFLDQITRVPAGAVSPAAPYQTPPNTLQDYITSIDATTVISGELKRTIIALANEAAIAFGVAGTLNKGLTEAKSEIDLFKQKLENWYDSNAERLVGYLKRKWAFPFTALLATAVTIGLNADTAAISKYLYDHKEAAKTIADNAVATIGQYKERVDKMRNADTATYSQKDLAQFDTTIQRFKMDVANLRNELPQDFPIGWPDKTLKEDNWGNHVPGWLATILAILLGAPFWFDLLNKVANIRGAGPKPPSTLDDTKGNTTINT